MKYLISDTREKKNQHVLDHFDKVGIRYEIAKLDYGDYMDAYRTDISIDRKQNIGELARNCTRESERFRREIERANKADSKLVILVEQNRYRDRARWIHVESIADLMLWSSPHTKIRGEKVYRALSSLCSRYNFEVVFCDKRSTGKKILEIIYGDSVGDRQ